GQPSGPEAAPGPGTRSPAAHGPAILPLIRDYVASSGTVAAGEAEAWAAEQEALAAAGEVFFSCTQCCFTAAVPTG
ncbi:MAG: hypothetical protein ACRDKW_06890, partial [Actinomycetota bacterium]